MATKKKGTLTGHQDIEGNDIRVGDLIEDIHTGKTYLVNKYGNLFSEKYGTRKISGMNVRIVDPTTEKLAETLMPAPTEQEEADEVEEILSTIPPYEPPVEVVPETEQSVPETEEGVPETEESVPEPEEKTAAEESYEIFKDCLESALEKQKRLEEEAREYLPSQFLADLLRERGYTVTAEKEVRYIKKL